jgi:hypothetical protein
MSQRDSGYQRKERDRYETPSWVTEALLPHIPERVSKLWEPACGSGKMVRVLEAAGYAVHATDIEQGQDFLDGDLTPGARIHGIITNPPYEFAQEFIERALGISEYVAMLLRADYDSAMTRQHLFGGCFIFARKIVLTKRIKWFEDTTGSPSFNHAWYVWDHQHQGAPTLAYA